MIHQSSSYILFPDIYQKRIRGITLFFNPLVVNNIELLEGWEKKAVSLLDGKKTLSDIYKCIRIAYPRITKEMLLASFSRFTDESLIFEAGKGGRILENGTREALSDHLSFWISLTDQCNFRCKYCFIKKDASFMSERGYERTIAKIISLIDKNNPRSVKIYYAGGEPLLNFEMLKRVHKRLLKIGQSKKIVLEETILTNGSLITEQILDYLKKEHLLVSVSLDGLKEANDKTRIYKNGTSTFSQVQKSLLLLKENNILRNVDIVISSQNINDISSFIMFLLDHKIFFVLNFYKFNSLSGDALYCKQDELVLQLKKIYKKIYAYYEKNNIMESPMEQLQLLDSVQFKEKRLRVCGAGRNYLTFRVDGTLDVCPLVYTGGHSQGKETLEVISSDILKGCKNCQWRYLCGGGCAAEKWIKHKNTAKLSEYCNVYKRLIPFLIDLEGEFILHNRIKTAF